MAAIDASPEQRQQPLLTEAGSVPLCRHSQCERCGKSTRASPGSQVDHGHPAEDAPCESTSRHACVFCQEMTTDSYVPRHLCRTVSTEARETRLRGADGDDLELLQDNAEDVVDSGNTESAPYSEALASHRGCAKCWRQWEMREAQQNTSELIVKCPMCALAVDIRQAYDIVLCKSCQKAVVARGGTLRLKVQQAFRRARRLGQRCQTVVALAMLCLLFGAQGLFSMVLWQICEESLQHAAQQNAGAQAAPAGGGDTLDNLLQPLFQPLSVASNETGHHHSHPPATAS